MKKILIFAVFLLTAGISGATNSFLTNFPPGFYITPTAGATLTTPLNQYFHVDSLANTNLIWVSTDTQYGGFLMELLPANAPKTVANFLAYVRDGAYENTIIHRSTSITNPNDGLTIIQTGGYTANGSLSSIPTFAPISNEYSLSNASGSVAMAKLGGNPNSATSQWFVNVSDNSTTLNSNNNGGFTVFAKIRGNGMSNVINRISLLQPYNLSGYNSAFTETPLQGVTNGQQTLYLSNLVTITRVATLPYFAFSSDSDACPADLVTSSGSTNLVITFKHYPTNNPINGIYVTLAVTDTNGQSPKYTNPNTKIAYDGGNTGFYVVPSTPSTQTITFPQIPQQALSNNITNITTNYIANGTNITIGSIKTNIYTSFTIPQPPYSSANIPILLQILSGPIKLTSNPNQTRGIPNGSQFTLTGTGTVTLKATTYGTDTYGTTSNDLVNNYYLPAVPLTNSFIIKARSQTISSFQTIFSPTYGNPPLQISIPSSSSGLQVAVKVLSGPATFNQVSNTGTITITGAGPITLAANQSGNDQYAAASQVTTTFTVSKGIQTISFPQSTTNISVGQTISLSATSSSALPVAFSLKSGSATLSGSSLKITGPGTVSVAVNQPGNSNYFPASEVINRYRAASNQTILPFGTITNRAYSTSPIAITVPTATSALPVSLSVKSGPASLLTSNSIALRGVGSITLAANQSGNSNNFAAPEVTTTFVVSKASQTIASFTGLPSKLTNGMAPFTITIPSASSGLTNTALLVSGAGKIASNNIITLTNAGTLTITATNAGNSNYLAASVTTNIMVALGSQSITFPFSSPLVVGTTNLLTATASSGLPVIYSLTPTSTNVALISNSIVVKSYTTNTFKVVASQTNTNTGWIVATPVTNSFTVTTNTPSSSTGGTLSLGGGSSGVTIVNGGSLTTGGSINSYLGGSTISNGALNLNSNSGNSTLSNTSISNTISQGTGTLNISNTINSGSTTNTNSLGGSISLATNVVIITSPTPTPTP
jgi:cyclophilin family peptidyl-prolyl cis-trans isomerase